MTIHPASLREHEHQRRVFWCRAYAAALGNANYLDTDTLAEEDADTALQAFDIRFPRPAGTPAPYSPSHEDGFAQS